jgi:hypothetical protein
VDNSLFIGVMMVLTSERVEKRPMITLTAFPSPIFTAVSMFLVSLPPLIAIV